MIKTELELVREYKIASDERRKNQIFNTLVKKYEGWLKLQTNKVYKSISPSFFGMEFEDCESEALYGFKLALDWFDESKCSGHFNSEKFSISYYAERQISARIGTYIFQRNKKQKRSIESDTQSETFIVPDSRNVEKDVQRKLQQERLDAKLSPMERKIKDYLMEGMIEKKIKHSLKICDSKLAQAKDRIGQVMTEIQFSPV